MAEISKDTLCRDRERKFGLAFLGMNRMRIHVQIKSSTGSDRLEKQLIMLSDNGLNYIDVTLHLGGVEDH